MALEPAGVVLEARNYSTYISQLQAISKAQKDAFNPTSLKDYQNAAKQLGDAYKNIPKSIPKIPTPSLPKPDDAKALQDALALLGQTGKYSIAQISEEALKLNAALALVKKSGQFEISQVKPIKSDALGQLTQNLDEAIAKGGSFKQMLTSVGDFMGGQFASILLKVGGVMGAIFSVNYAVNFIKGLEQASVAANSQFENYETQFQTLLGSVSAAKKRISELAEFGIKTPYELPEIVHASRLLQVFGGTALATGKNLEIIGDTAASVNANFGEVAMWTGRMYSAMKSGRPFGEASMRMQELGILSGTVRNKLEQMQKSGVSGAEIWKYYSDTLQKNFGGSMERLANTLQGIQSNIADFQGMLLRVGGGEYFETLKAQTKDFYTAISSTEGTEALKNLAVGFGHIASEVRKVVFQPFIDSLKSMDMGQVKQLGESVYNLGTAIGKFSTSGNNAKGVNGIVAGLTDLTNAATTIITPLSTLYKWLDKVGLGFFNLNRAVEAVNLWEKVDPISNAIKVLTGQDISGWLNTFAGSAENVDSPLTNIHNHIEATDQALGNAGQSADDFADAENTAKEAADKLKDSLQKQIDTLEATKDAYNKAKSIQENYQQSVAKAGEEYQKSLTEATDKYQKERAKKVAEFNQKLAEFDQENARKRAQMIDEFNFNQANALKQFNLQRQQAEQNYNLQAKQEKRKFYDDQKRALRDFQLSILQEQRRQQINDTRMRADGDVLALMQAREDFALQQQENQENFKNTQQTAKEAYEEQQKTATENFALQEQQARDSFALQTEIQREEFDRRLAEFDENVALQREKMIEANAQELADMDAKFEEEKAKLYEQYQEKLAMAAEQKGKELQALGDSLKEQGKVTEEGMKDIADKISEVFGDKAAGDQLIKGWSDRSKSEINNLVDDLTAKIAELKQSMETIDKQKGTPYNPATSSNRGSGTSAGGGGGSGSGGFGDFGQGDKPIGARHGFQGVVMGPKTFKIEPGMREHVQITPLNRGGSMRHSGSIGMNLNVSGMGGTMDDQLAKAVIEKASGAVIEGLKLSIRRLSRRGN